MLDADEQLDDVLRDALSASNLAATSRAIASGA